MSMLAYSPHSLTAVLELASLKRYKLYSTSIEPIRAFISLDHKQMCQCVSIQDLTRLNVGQYFDLNVACVITNNLVSKLIAT